MAENNGKAGSVAGTTAPRTNPAESTTKGTANFTDKLQPNKAAGVATPAGTDLPERVVPPQAPTDKGAEQTTLGNVNETDLTRPNTTNNNGADDVRSQLISDAAAESSTDTAEQLVDPNAGTHQIAGRDALTVDDIELAEAILKFRTGGSRQDVEREVQRKRADRMVNEAVRHGKQHGGDMVYFRSSIPAFSFRPGRGMREQFKDNYYATSNPGIQYYIRTQLMNVINSSVQIEEVTEQQFRNDRTIVQPIIEPLPGGGGLNDVQLQRAALFTKAPRTDMNPDPITPETGNGARDQLSDRQIVSTAGQVREAVREHRDDVVQQRRNTAEFMAAQGDGVSRDALANSGTTGGATAGATTTTTPAGAPKGGVTTGMQNSTGPSSAPQARQAQPAADKK